MRNRRTTARVSAVALGLSMLQAWGAPGDIAVANLADLTLEQLSNIEVTSVSGRPESLQEAASSVYVITGEDIRRSAATSLPEALRLAPNLQVARLNAAQYSISARGFNNAIGNKLLVLVDGRIVYSAVFSGVFWDQSDVALEDIERIEVISGPGGTLWGANAVNGVINVITKTASDTQGLRLAATRSKNGGHEMARWGGAMGEAGHYRVYALAADHDNTSRADGVQRADQASKNQAGFRTDFAAGRDSFTVQGDAYEGGKYPANNLAPRIKGGNLLGRWNSALADGSPFTFQGYLDYADRDDVNFFRDRSRTADVGFTHEPRVGQGHQLLWGAGYRETRQTNPASTLAAFVPVDKTLHWTNVFAQEDLTHGSWQLTLGAKAERNDYSGWEFLPNARVTYRHSPSDMTWAALSRAVRAPARLDREFFIPAKPPYAVAGGPLMDSEIANVAEIGHRGYIGTSFSYSGTLFVQQYDRLRTGSGTVPSTVVNGIKGNVNGLEAWATWQPRDDWRLSAGILALREHLHPYTAKPDPAGIANLGNDPREQYTLRSSHTWGRTEFDLMARHVGSLPAPYVAGYTALDARLAFRVNPRLEISLLGQNLLDARHVEYNAVSMATQVERAVFIKADWEL